MKIQIKKKASRLMGRNAWVVFLLVAQLVLLLLIVNYLPALWNVIYPLLTVLSFVMVWYIINRPYLNPAYKISWVMPMLVFPLFGGALYLLYQLSFRRNTFRYLTQQKLSTTRYYLEQNQDALSSLKEDSPGMANLCNYLYRVANAPVYFHTQAQYYPLGDDQFPTLIQDLRQAKEFIFLEFFIVHEGTLWDEIHAILKEKAAQGLDVRLLYDGFGSQINLPEDYDMLLRQEGIQCRIFNPVVPILSSAQNNRDHRKIVVIDGKIAFTGGTNLADEYANLYTRFGHWKDTAVRLTGDAVWTLTVLFLRMWEWRQPVHENYRLFYRRNTQFSGNGYVIPFGDTPLDDEQVGKSVYLSILNHACRYVYIYTPYLVLDHELITALTLAAQSGVEVRILLPHIPDKRYVYFVAQSFYKELLERGVRIYEYTPGFNHAKMFLSDDAVGVVGTINLDYRGLYLNFENGVLFYQNSVLSSMKEDMEKNFASSHLVTLKEVEAFPLWRKLAGSILRMFAPLL